MLSDSEINYQKDPDTTRLNVVDGVVTTLKYSDVDTLVGAFRTVLGSIEQRDNMELQETLEALDDSAAGARDKAAKMAALVVRLQTEDFGVSILTEGMTNSDNDQRNLYIIYGISELWPLPDELIYQDNIFKLSKISRVTSSVVKTIRVP